MMQIVADKPGESKRGCEGVHEETWQDKSEGINRDRRQSAAAWLPKLCLRRFCEAGLESGRRTRRRGGMTNVKIYCFLSFSCLSPHPKAWRALCLRPN